MQQFAGYSLPEELSRSRRPVFRQVSGCLLYTSGLDFQSAKGGLGELKRRLLFVIGALIVFRIGSFIPIPGLSLIHI